MDKNWWNQGSKPVESSANAGDGWWRAGAKEVAPSPPERSALAAVNDTVIEAANAVAGGVSAAANFVKPGNAVSNFIDDKIIKAGEESQSDVVKASKKKFRDEVEAADGISGELGAVGSYVLENPVLSAAQAAGSFVGPGAAIKGAGAAARAVGAGAKAVERAGLAGGAAAGAAMAGGDAAGTAYDLATKAGATDEQATAAGRQASIIPAIVGGAGSLVGAERLVAGAKGFAGGAASRAAKIAAVEAAQEGFEEGITQYEGQRAAVPFDPTIDPAKGVAAAAGMGAALGGITGGGVSLLTGGHGGTEAPAPAAAPLLLTNEPDPLVAFPDGTVGRQQEIDTYLASLPEDQRATARARMMGMAPQPSPPTTEAPAGAPALPSAPLPSQAMGIDPNAGPLSASAAIAVDSGVHGQMLQDAQRQVDDAALAEQEQAAAAGRVAPPVLDYSGLDERDRGLYDDYFRTLDRETEAHMAAALVDDVPDFGSRNVTDEEFLRALGANEQEIADALQVTRGAAGPQESAVGAVAPAADVAGGARPAAAAAPAQQGQAERAQAVAQAPAEVGAAPASVQEGIARARARRAGSSAPAAAPAPAPAAAAGQPVPAARREKALRRVEEGKAWFLSRDKALNFVETSGLADTHEVAPDNRRFVVQAKAAPEQSQTQGGQDVAAARGVRVADDGARGAAGAAPDTAGRPARGAQPDEAAAARGTDSAGAVSPVPEAVSDATRAGDGQPALKGSEQAGPAAAVDAAAHEAATSPQNDSPEPTQAQKAAGNYKMGHLSGDEVQGLRISIENPHGSTRSGTSPDGTNWSNTMGAHYGYVKGSEAADGDHVDVFVGPHAATAPTVYVVDQVNADGSYDEAKALFGFNSEAEAVAAYKASYDAGWKVGPVTSMSVDEFKAGLEAGRFMKALSPSLQPVAKPARGVLAKMQKAKDQGTVKAARTPQSVEDVQGGGKIVDFGEKIGGARKDRAEKTGARAAATPKDNRPAWARRFQVTQIAKSRDASEDGRWVIRDTRSLDWSKQPRQVGRDSYSTQEEAEVAIPLAAVSLKHRVTYTRDGKFEIWRDVTDRKRVKVVEQAFDAREDALQYMAENAQSIIETNTTFGEADLPRPASEQRIGAERRTGDVKDGDFTDTFGFRGVEFGNWNNQADRQQLLNDAYDGLLDLADVMGIPPRAISLDGELALAFGARGSGLSGARAHYEPEKAVINLTKMNGAGSLAHEWFHAMDHYFGRQDGKAPTEWMTDKDGTRSLKVNNDFERNAASGGTRGERSGMRAEVQEAYRGLMNTISRKAEQYTEDTAKADKFVGTSRKEVEARLAGIRKYLAEKLPDYFKRNNKPATAEQLAEFDTLAQQIIDGEALELRMQSKNPAAAARLSGFRWTNDVLEKMSGILKAVRGQAGFSADQKGTLDALRGDMQRYSQRLKMLADAQGSTEKTRAVPTSFAMDARELDQGRGQDYWTTPHEMAARAFQGYVEDKIAERGGTSPFLNYGPESAGILTPWGVKRPFPHGAERVAINQALDKLVGVIQTREGNDGNVALFSRSNDTRDAFETRIDALFAGGTATTGTRILDTSDVMGLLGYPKVPMMLNESHLRDSTTTHPEMTAAAWKKVPDWLESPAAVYRDGGKSDRLIVIAPETIAGYPVFLVVEPNPTPARRGHSDPFQLLVTAYAKTTGGLPSPGYLATSGQLLYVDTKNAPEVWQRAGGQFPGQAALRGRQKILTEKHLGGYRRANNPAFSKGEGGGMSVDDAQRAADAIRGAWANGPEVVVVPSMQDPAVPQRVREHDAEQKSQGAEGEPEGFFFGGKAYIVAGQLSSQQDVARVLMHEALGHFGLRGVFGKALTPVLQQVATMRKADVRAKAEQYGLDFNDPAQRLTAAEEVLAEMAQTSPQVHFVRRAVAAIRTWLRDNVPGLRYLRMTDDEVIRNYILPARRFVEQGGPDGGGGARANRAAFNRDTATSPTTDGVFSRSKVADFTRTATAELNKTFSAPGTLSWWDKTVGTMYHLAERAPAFKPVFEAAQGFVDDVSFFANDAAELAPKLLPKLETWRDIKKSPVSAADNAAVAKPVFEGTLTWARDESGKPVQVQALIDAAASLTTEQKAQRLLRNGHIDDRMLKAWQGMPLESYEKAVSTRFESRMLQPGVVWSDAELRNLFQLTNGQIALYREFREATDRSLDTMARADMLRFAGDDVKGLRSMVMDAPDAQAAAVLLRDHLVQVAGDKPDRATLLLNTANGIMDRADKVRDLQARGYAPLSRFGRFTVDVVDGKGERQYFGLFESAREANTMAARMREEFNGAAVNQGTLSEEAFKLFAGVTPETLELFGNALGLDSTGDAAQDRAFQEYLKLTKTNRSAMRRLIHRKGIAGFSEDVGRVLAAFVYSNARQTAAGLHMGDLGEAVQAIPKEQGELKDAAVRLADYVKNPQEEAQAVRGLLFAQYLGGSIASALVNALQPVQVTFPWLSQHGGAKAAAAQIGRAAKDLAARGKNYEPDLAAALKRAEAEGVVAPQEVHQLMAQARGAGTLRSGDGTRTGDLRAVGQNALSRVSLAWGKVFGAAEQLNRRITFIAAYRTAKAHGVADPSEFARRAITETQFLYSKANKMEWGRGAIGGTLMTFKTYSVAYLELLHRMYTQGGPEGKRATLLALGMLLLMGGAGGLPFAEDLEDAADGLGQMLGYNFSAKKARQEFLESMLPRSIAQFIDKGVSGLPGAPLDVSGRLGMGNLIPGTGLLLEKTSHARDVLEIAGPAGDFASRILSGGRSVLTGDVGAGVLEMSPAAVRNAAKGADMAATGMYRDAKGYKVLDTNSLEAAMKAIGFQPGSVANIQEANRISQGAKAFYNLRAQEIRAQWAQGVFESDPAKVQAARDAMADWNRKNPDQPMTIRIPDVMKRVREMRKSKDERIADTAPRAMRAQLREDAARARADL